MKKNWGIKTIGMFILAGTFMSLPFFNSVRIQAETPQAPEFSKESGEYTEGFDLTLSAPSGCRIYYTTDGSIPLAKEDEKKDTDAAAAPVPTEKAVSFDLSEANTAYNDSVEVTEKENGTELAFAYQYRSVCFRVPSGETDWSKYQSIVIEYSVDNASDGETVGLQVCPIFEGSPGSYGFWGEYRSFEARTTAGQGDQNEAWEIDLSDKNVSSIGWIMLGATTNESRANSKDTITVHSIRLVSDSAAKEATEKMDTLEYTKPISVKNRAGEENVLAANASLMYDTSVVSAYTPKASEVAKATVIRAISVDAQGNRSKVVTKTYFVGNNLAKTYKNATVMSIVTDPDNLLDKETGIYRKENYANSGKEWERPAYVEYFDEDGTIPFSTDMGIRLHGGWSRNYGQKSFNLYFREEYGGLKSLKNYQLIPNALDADGNAIKKYKSVMLRNGGNDTEYTKLQDVWIQNLVKDRNFATQASRPCVLFLNGEYWGVYNLMEKYSDNSIAEEFGVAKDNVVIIKDDAVDEGKEEDIDLYDSLQNFANFDMTKQGNYDKFCEMVDLSSYIDYYALGIYIGNYDWPQKNTACWRVREQDGTKYGDGKWRWLVYDTEYSMNLYGHSTGSSPLKWVLEKDELFASVFKNEEFQKQFARTMFELMNVNFEETSAIASLDEYAAVYKPLMKDYFKRYGLSSNNFTYNIDRIKTFIQGRRATIVADLKKKTSVDLEEAENPQPTETPAASETSPAATSEPAAGENSDGAQLSSAKTIQKPAKVTKLKAINKKKTSFTLTWKKLKNVKGYKIVLAADKKFKKQKRTLTAAASRKKIKGLKKNKKYYIHVRAYRINKNGKKLYGAWSKTCVYKNNL